MAINTEILKDRLREAFGSDSQETVGKKLNMTQGNISKLLSGSQQPTLETIYHVAQTYDVSVDWLLGISDRKSVDKSIEEVTYASAVIAAVDLKQHSAQIDRGKYDRDVSIKITDPLLVTLINKALTLHSTDRDLYQNWIDQKLTLFEDKALLYSSSWEDQTVSFLVGQASTESNWLEVYEAAAAAEERFAEMMGEDESPFSG